MVAAAVAAAAACGASAGASGRHRSGDVASCTWGASSISASGDDGQVVETPPATSGCVSPP
ncbi:MAG TPA: hypothetical protein VFA66_10610 [Gaiellaceae bacterium]|nr:hypothetical protein [Gaiellaceae bacterium]